MGPYSQQFGDKQKGAKSVFNNPYWTGGQGYGQAALSGMAAGASIAPEEDRFSIDPNAGFKGSFAGLSQGGVVGAIAGGITSQLGTFSRVNKNLKNFNAGFQGFNSDGFGAPQYNAGAFQGAQQTVNELEDGQRAIKRSWDPATRAFSGIMGTGRRLRRAQRQQEGSIRQQRAEFNEANESYQRQQLARRAYEDQISNIYGIPGGYY